ncbi:Gar1/Naf1 RNA binding region-domain-containing protein [Zopfochytrium polystomum]|nr:Gar1/Naf1 RNA binding region-domain-containing protein [Zopfochytrium polystomum]
MCDNPSTPGGFPTDLIDHDNREANSTSSTVEGGNDDLSLLHTLSESAHADSVLDSSTSTQCNMAQAANGLSRPLNDVNADILGVADKPDSQDSVDSTSHEESEEEEGELKERTGSFHQVDELLVSESASPKQSQVDDVGEDADSNNDSSDGFEAILDSSPTAGLPMSIPLDVAQILQGRLMESNTALKLIPVDDAVRAQPLASDADGSDDDQIDDNEESDFNFSDSDEEANHARPASKVASKAVRKDDESESDDDENGRGLRTKNEIVPPVDETVQIEIPQTARLDFVGIITSFVEDQVIIEASGSGDHRVLDADSIMVLEDRTVIGRVFETFGPVTRPMYLIRLARNSPVDKSSLGQKAFCVPELAHYVFTSQLRLMQGSDASNIYDEEVGEDEMEFSDDEKEAEFRRMKKSLRKPRTGEPAGPSTGPSSNLKRRDRSDQFQSSTDRAERAPKRPNAGAEVISQRINSGSIRPSAQTASRNSSRPYGMARPFQPPPLPNYQQRPQQQFLANLAGQPNINSNWHNHAPDFSNRAVLPPSIHINPAFSPMQPQPHGMVATPASNLSTFPVQDNQLATLPLAVNSGNTQMAAQLFTLMQQLQFQQQQQQQQQQQFQQQVLLAAASLHSASASGRPLDMSSVSSILSSSARLSALPTTAPYLSNAAPSLAGPMQHPPPSLSFPSPIASLNLAPTSSPSTNPTSNFEGHQPWRRFG